MIFIDSVLNYFFANKITDDLGWIQSKSLFLNQLSSCNYAYMQQIKMKKTNNVTLLKQFFLELELKI